MEDPVEKVIGECLKGSDQSRISTVTKALKKEGVATYDDLKYFDWNALKFTNKLSNMEIKKIMQYIKKNFPAEYDEHKKRMNEETKLKQENELLQYKAEQERELQAEQSILNYERQQQLIEYNKHVEEMEENIRKEGCKGSSDFGKMELFRKVKEKYNDWKEKGNKLPDILYRSLSFECTSGFTKESATSETTNKPTDLKNNPMDQFGGTHCGFETKSRNFTHRDDASERSGTMTDLVKKTSIHELVINIFDQSTEARQYAIKSTFEKLNVKSARDLFIFAELRVDEFSKIKNFCEAHKYPH